MTNQEISKLADIIVRRLIDRQQYYDEKFINIIMNIPETEEAEEVGLEETEIAEPLIFTPDEE